ncbi:hypothetical protein NKY68_00180 [Sinorhizobium meliloti]
MGLIPFHRPEFVDRPNQPIQLSEEFGGWFPPHPAQFVSVSWSSDPALGLPVAPAIVAATLEPVSIDGYSRRVDQVVLEKANGFEEHLIGIGPPVALDGLLCVLAFAAPAEPCDIYAVDASGEEIPETRQHVVQDSRVTLLGPGVFGLRSTAAATLYDVLLIGLHENVELKFTDVAEVAPYLVGVGCYEPQMYLGVLDGAQASLVTRLKADSLARANTHAPASNRLDYEVHRARPDTISNLVLQQKFVVEAASNYSSIFADPTWSYSEAVPRTMDAEFEVVPAAMIQAVALIGPVEATTLGHAVSFPINSAFPSIKHIDEVFDFIRNEGRLPFPIVRVETFHAGHGFVDTGSVRGNRADPNTKRGRQLARLIFAEEEGVEAVPTKARPPVELDKPASCDVRLVIGQKIRLDSFYVEKVPRSDDFFEEDIVGSRSIKAYFPNVDETDVSAMGRAQFVTGPFDLPLEGAGDKALGVYRRDVFGRWPKTPDAHCLLPPWPVQAPTLGQSKIQYTARGRVLLTNTISWDWALRTPNDLRLGLVIADRATDPILQESLPSGGLNLPGQPGRLQLSIVFDGQGNPAWSAPVSEDFSIDKITPPQPDPDEQPASRGQPGDPDPRLYQLTIPLGSTSTLFAETPSAFVALTSDAWEVVSGSTEDRRSTMKARAISRLDDPRPPSLVGSLWSLQWASRANGANVAKAFLKAPETTGATHAAGFNIWRASESSLLDFALEGEDGDAAALLDAVRRETNMRVRLNLVQNLVIGRLDDTASLERFAGLFRAADTTSSDRGYEIDIPGTQSGLEFAMFTATSKTGVSSAKFDQKGLSNLYAIAIPVAVPPQQPSLRIITRDPLDLLARSGLCIAVVGFEQHGSQRKVRFFWEDGPDVIESNQVLQQLDPITELSVVDAKRYVEDIEAILDRVPFGRKQIYMLRPPESWLPHCFCIDTIGAMPIGLDDPMHEVASRRSPLVRTSLIPTSLPALIPNAFPENGRWTVEPKGLFAETVPGFVPCEIMISLNDSAGVEQDRSGPISYRNFVATGLTLAPDIDAQFDLQDATITVRFGGTPSGYAIKLTATDPVRRAVQVNLPIF